MLWLKMKPISRRWEEFPLREVTSLLLIGCAKGLMACICLPYDAADMVAAELREEMADG